MSTKTGEGFSSSFGAIMAAAGSAVGLGNIWRFPYICGKYGGGAFLLVYICFVFLIGMILMMSEFVIGRRTGEDPMKAYPLLRPHRPQWKYVGFLGLVTCFLILAIYLVISGWTLNYFWESLTGTLASIPDNGFKEHFESFASSTFRPVIFVIAFLVFTTLVIIGGVEKGIERVSKLLMPFLVVLLLVMCVRSLTLDGASTGLAYLFQPDFSKLTGEGVLAALGQALFSLSVGMGVMIVYGSYLPVDDNILKTSVWITICDFAIAILSGIAIFPAVFACGQNPSEGPGLVYQVLPVVFNSFGNIGRIFSIVFFLLLSLAALTSAISLLEALTQWLSGEKIKRTPSAIIMSLMVIALAIAASFSYGDGILSGMKIGGMQLFALLDKLTGTLLPPICALLTIIFFGWFMKKEDIMDELSNHGTLGIGYFKVFYYFLSRFVAPAALLIVLLAGILG
ncbi:MAG: sodium-dependent transporter [Bacteroidales bacterium]|nr:sodium-dependent transporter [Bacteroidales bacterium]